MRDDVAELVRTVFRACEELSQLTGRPVSPDGHLVGSIGEIVAADLLDLELMPPSTTGYDAIDRQGRKVEIKCTTRRTIALSAAGTEAERLAVLTLDRHGAASVVYDGPCAGVWQAAGPVQRNGQRAFGLARLAVLAEEQAPATVAAALPSSDSANR